MITVLIAARDTSSHKYALDTKLVPSTPAVFVGSGSRLSARNRETCKKVAAKEQAGASFNRESGENGAIVCQGGRNI